MRLLGYRISAFLVLFIAALIGLALAGGDIGERELPTLVLLCAVVGSYVGAHLASRSGPDGADR